MISGITSILSNPALTRVAQSTSSSVSIETGLKAVGRPAFILADKKIDAVHLVTPIPLHAEQTVKVLEAGKHCACTVPMATSLEDIRRITDAVRKSGKNYMMMETSLYT